MPTAVITGGAGFIGANLVRLLVGEGWTVRVFDDLSVGQPAAIDDTPAELVTGDVNDVEELAEATTGADVLFHLAAGAGVIASVEDPLGNFHVNARGCVSALSAAREAAVPRVVFSSSNAPLGPNAYPAREDAPLRPLSPYGASKMAGEAYAIAFYETYGLETVVTRFSNAYGPFSRHKTNVIPTFIRHIERGDPLIVYGDGEQTRDFVFVEDLCRSLLAAATSPETPGEIFQLASGVETTVNQLIELLRGLAEGDVEVEYRPARAGEIVRNYSDIAKARRVLGLEAPVMLADGLAATWRHFASSAPSREG